MLFIYGFWIIYSWVAPDSPTETRYISRMPTSLTDLIGNFVTGAAAIPALLVIGYFISFNATLQGLQTGSKSIFVFLTTYSSAAWLFTGMVGISCVVLGILLDFVGHELIDKHVFDFRRDKVIPEDERSIILNSLPEGSSLKFDTLLQSYFYTHAPEHLLQYHGEQWAYCEFCRNAALVASLYLIAGCLVFIKLHYWGWTIAWCLLWAGIVYIILLVLRFGISYYYRIETVFAIGWLMEKGLLKNPTTTPLPAPQQTAGPQRG